MLMRTNFQELLVSKGTQTVERKGGRQSTRVHREFSKRTNCRGAAVLIGGAHDHDYVQPLLRYSTSPLLLGLVDQHQHQRIHDRVNFVPLTSPHQPLDCIATASSEWNIIIDTLLWSPTSNAAATVVIDTILISDFNANLLQSLWQRRATAAAACNHPRCRPFKGQTMAGVGVVNILIKATIWIYPTAIVNNITMFAYKE